MQPLFEPIAWLGFEQEDPFVPYPLQKKEIPRTDFDDVDVSPEIVFEGFEGRPEVLEGLRVSHQEQAGNEPKVKVTVGSEPPSRCGAKEHSQMQMKPDRNGFNAFSQLLDQSVSHVPSRTSFSPHHPSPI